MKTVTNKVLSFVLISALVLGLSSVQITLMSFAEDIELMGDITKWAMNMIY